MRNNDVEFSLPFNGTWLTFWGGDTPEKNHHHGTQSQKFAFDFIIVDSKGNFYQTNGHSNEDYFSFGQEILAPADGKIIEVVNGLRDNKPGELNSFNYIGNYIMIKHEKSLYSVLGHLKQDSAVVKVGDKVMAGERVAQCGNSGYTTDPHLHFHVQDSDVFARIDGNFNRVDIAKGKKIYFNKLKVGNRAKKNYSPIKGDKVKSLNN